MKYCHECGTKLENLQEIHTNVLKTKEGTSNKKSKMLRAASIMVFVAIVFSIYIGIFGIGFSWEQHQYNYNEYSNYYFHPEKMIAGIFGFFGFMFGMLSGILLHTQKMFSFSLFGIGVLAVAAALSSVIGIPAFIVLGLPILIMGTISIVFVCVSRKEFLS